MEGYQTDEQRFSAVVNMLSSNKKVIIMFFVILLSIITAKYWYEEVKDKSMQQASKEYEKVLLAIEDGKVEQAVDLSEMLIRNHQNSPYAILTGMYLAKVKLNDSDMLAAIEQLKQVVKKSNKENPLWHVAKVRLARLLHKNGQSDQALAELEKDPKGYIALYEELKGDIYVETESLDKAKIAYKKAIENTYNDNKNWIIAKLADIGGNYIEEENN